MQHKLFVFFAILLACVTLSACADDGGETSFFSSSDTRKTVSSEELQFTTPATGDPIVTFTTDLGSFSAVLYPDIAPQACENFIALAESGFYDGTSFDRVISGFCVQGGLDAEGNATTIWGGSAYPIEVSDTLHHYAGALCAAASDDATASSPFYIVQAMPSDVSDAMVSAMEDAAYREEVMDAYTAAGGVPYLDYTDTVFGQIYDGMDVIDAIAALETDEDDTPLEAVVITSVTVGSYS